LDSRRVSGILLHITSLPSKHGIGDLGPEAFSFIDLLTRTGQQLWQVLPLGPVGHGASPYSSHSTFAGNPLLISPEPLVESGLLTREDLKPLRELPASTVDYERLIPRKQQVLRKAFDRHRNASLNRGVDSAAVQRFRTENAEWLETYALYAALKEEHDGAAWTDWDSELARRDAGALDRARTTLETDIDRHIFWQFLFHRQWSAVRAACHARDIRLFGDLPIYVAHDSADVWANQELFRLDEAGQPKTVAGVPPDYFSPEGQRWGNPIYRWDRMQSNDYRWWKRRMEHILNRVDLVRLDHFRGFDAYWEIPADHDTAVNGEWRDGPGIDFFESMADHLGDLPVIAEDLGIITDSVRTLRDRMDFPGMAVLQFAFDNDPSNGFLPHNYDRNLVAYTGTHDNNTLLGWWNAEVQGEDRAYAERYLDLDRCEDPVHARCLRALLSSVADRVVTPLQDILGLGEEARMNVPGEPGGNWRWRYTPDQIDEASLERLRVLTETFGRAPQ
jgi:4-alpha-glucanotransferase